MLRYLRSTFGSSYMSGMFACVLAMLVALPVLKARADIGSCHEARVETLSALSGTHIHDVGHEHPVAMHTHDDDSENRMVVHTRSKTMEHTSKPQAECCLPGCGLAVIASAYSVEGPFAAAIKPCLPVTKDFTGLDPSAPRKPPRTTDIAALAA
jgi:hypothetical protein